MSGKATPADQRLLVVLVVSLPLLLLVVVAAGEINERFDRSDRVEMRVTANAIDGTPVMSPMLRLGWGLLQNRDVPEGFSVGQDVFLGFEKKGGVWQFLEVRPRRDAPNWTSTRVDIPARVSKSYEDKLVASPLLPEQFAISRETIRTLNRQAILDLTLRRGALGTVWIESAVEAGLPLGNVVALVPSEDGSGVSVVGQSTGTFPAGFKTEPDTEGWIAPLVDLEIDVGEETEGRPVGAIRLDGKLVVATTKAYDNHFYVEGERLSGSFVGFEEDGSFWRLVPDPFPAGGDRHLIRTGLDGRVVRDVDLGSELLLDVKGDAVLTGAGYEVRWYRIDDGKVLAHSWTIEGRGEACLAGPDLAFAQGSEGAFLLAAGEENPRRIVESTERLSPGLTGCDRAGNVLITRRLVTRQYEPNPTGPVFVWTQDGELTAVGEFPIPDSVEGAAWMESSPRVLRVGDRLFVAAGGEIVVFDLRAGKLLQRITMRATSDKRRVL